MNKLLAVIRPRIGHVAAAILVLAVATSAVAQERYKTPDEAVAALVTAAKAADPKGVMRVLGPGSAEIVSSGDTVADAATRKRFIEAYDAKHQVAMDGADKATLVIGAKGWPFPIPLVRRDGIWRFDTAAGRQEILYRRVGRNELSAIQASHAYVDAQQDYAQQERAGGGTAAYAQRIVSRPGKKDGLFWQAKQGEAQSPLGEFAARASTEGYRAGPQPAPITATTTGSSRARGRTPPAGHWTTSCAAT